MDRRLLDVGDGMLHSAGEGVHRHRLSVFRSVDGSFRGILDAVALQCGELHNLTAQGLAQFGNVDLVTVLPDHIHHIDGYHYGNPQLRQLGGQVQVPFQVGAVHNV